MNMGIVITSVFLGTLALGLPVAVCLGLTSVIGFASLNLSMDYVAQTAFTAVDDFTTIAVPMFMLAGSLMEKGGLTLRLINFAKSIVGRKAGGLAIVTIVACTMFGAISGSGVATCAAIGSIVIPAMIREGYGADFAGAVTACSGGVGAVIPPSILMIVFGVSAEASITALFVGGIIPGILLGLFLSTAAVIVSKKRKYKTDAPKMDFWDIVKAAWNAKWALFTPILILGGIYGGVFTVTEASVVSVVYALFVVTFIYKEMSWNVFISSLIDAARSAGTILLIITTGRMFGRLITVYQVPQMASQFLVEYISSPVVLVLVIDAFFLFIGMWMESSTQIIILTPLLLPVLVSMGVNPVQFGIMFVIGCEIGFETPPLGINLFVASELAGTTIEKISREALPFVLAESTVLVLVSLIPELSLFLPRLMGLIV
ncbi:MAG: TRAP transporter large permease [Spirochaetales bacterium]|jgi:C4-dicarboxylate transporter DctM subunit|nr:TRAP transporter large permease [Spirochaetales bacterium]